MTKLKIFFGLMITSLHITTSHPGLLCDMLPGSKSDAAEQPEPEPLKSPQVGKFR